MTLIERLLDWSEGPDTDDLCHEAADYIEALEREIERLKYELKAQAIKPEQKTCVTADKLWPSKDFHMEMKEMK
jgi:hypothetical protein